MAVDLYRTAADFQILFLEYLEVDRWWVFKSRYKNDTLKQEKQINWLISCPGFHNNLTLTATGPQGQNVICDFGLCKINMIDGLFDNS